MKPAFADVRRSAGMGRSSKFWGYENLGIEPDVSPVPRAWAASRWGCYVQIIL